MIYDIQPSKPARKSFQSPAEFSQIHPERDVFIFIDDSLKQSDQRCDFLSAREGRSQIGEEEEEEDGKRESRTEMTDCCSLLGSL